MKRLGQGDCMARPVEEIGISKGDVLRAQGHELADVGYDDLWLNDAEPPSYTGTTGQCRHRCLHPRLASV